MLRIHAFSFICMLICFTLILCLLPIDLLTAFILSLIINVIFKLYSRKNFIKKSILILLTGIIFLITTILSNIFVALITTFLFIISIISDRYETANNQELNDYKEKVKSGETLYKNVIISNKSPEVILISREVPFPENRLNTLKDLLKKYKDNCCANRTILTKSFIDYDINKFTSESLKKFFDEKDMFIPLKYKKPIESKEIFEEIETILNLKYSYKELTGEEIKLLLNWVFAVDCDEEVTTEKTGAIFDITNEHLYSYKLARKNETISEYNYNMIKKLNPDLTNYTDILGNEVMFTYHY